MAPFDVAQLDADQPFAAISDLPPATSSLPTDQFEVNQGGVSKSVTLAILAAGALLTVPLAFGQSAVLGPYNNPNTVQINAYPQGASSGKPDSLAIMSWANAPGGGASPDLYFTYSRGGDVPGTHGLLLPGDYTMWIDAQGSDGTQWRQSAAIGAIVEGTPAAGSIPARLVFLTTSPGDAFATERMRIYSSGITELTGGLNVYEPLVGITVADPSTGDPYHRWLFSVYGYHQQLSPGPPAVYSAGLATELDLRSIGDDLTTGSGIWAPWAKTVPVTAGQIYFWLEPGATGYGPTMQGGPQLTWAALGGENSTNVLPTTVYLEMYGGRDPVAGAGHAWEVTTQGDSYFGYNALHVDPSGNATFGGNLFVTGAGQFVQGWTANASTFIKYASPTQVWWNTTNGTNLKIWDTIVEADGGFQVRSINDAYNAALQRFYFRRDGTMFAPGAIAPTQNDGTVATTAWVKANVSGGGGSIGSPIGGSPVPNQTLYVDGSGNLAQIPLSYTAGVVGSTSTTWHFGVDGATVPISEVYFQSIAAGTANTFAPDARFFAPRGTGTGTGGGFSFYVAPAGTAGSAQNNYIPILTFGVSGLSLSRGEMTLPASAAANAGLNLGQGVAPSSPINGDIWITSTGLFARVNGVTQGPYGSGAGAITTISGGTGITVTGGTGPTATIAITNQLVAAGPIGDASHVAQITYNAQGQLTAVASVAITPAAIGAISNASTIAAGGPTGSATAVPVLTYNAQGQLTAVTTAATVGSVGAGTGVTIGGTATAPTVGLSNVIAAGGPTGSATAIPIITYNAQGQLTVVSTAATVGSVTAGTGITIGGTGTAPTVGITNTGVVAASYGDVTHIPTFTVNAQGQLTAAGTVALSTVVTIAVTPPASPTVGQLWWFNDGSSGGGSMMIWYDDGNTQQWVPTAGGAGGGLYPFLTVGATPINGTIGGTYTKVLYDNGGTLAETTSLGLSFLTIGGGYSSGGVWDLNGWVYQCTNVGANNPSPSWSQGIALAWNNSNGQGEVNIVERWGAGFWFQHWNGSAMSNYLFVGPGGIRLGSSVDTPTPAPYWIIAAENVAAGTLNTSAGDLFIRTGEGTGNATAAKIIFQQSFPGASGTAQNGLTNVLTLGYPTSKNPNAAIFAGVGTIVQHTPQTDDSYNGFTVGQTAADATQWLGRFYVTGANAAHAACIDLYSGSIVGSQFRMFNTSSVNTILFAGQSGNATFAGQVTSGYTIPAGDSTATLATTQWVNANGGVQPGSLVMFAGATAPSGWLLCFGQAISRTTYSALFAAISTTYGVGDGSTTFNLPDLRGRAVFGADAMGGTAAGRLGSGSTGGITGTASVGASGGAQSHTLTSAQQASMSVPGVSGGAAGGSTLLQASANPSLADAGLVASGGGGAHNNLPPALVMNFIIKT